MTRDETLKIRLALYSRSLATYPNTGGEGKPYFYASVVDLNSIKKTTIFTNKNGLK